METKIEEQKKVSMPVDKLSYSGLTQLLRNPLIFKLKQILGVYDSKVGVSAMIGRAGHEALKYYYGGVKELAVSADRDERRHEATAYGMDYLTKIDDFYIKYGKTGTRENMLADYAKSMQIYWAEEPEYNNIIACEERMEAEIKNHDGQVFPLPAVGVPDLIEECADKTVDIIDTKFVKSFTKYENDDGEPHEDYIKIIQAKFLDYLLKSTKNIQAKRVIFREIKRSINKDGGAQIQDYVIPLDHSPYDIIFINLYADVIKFISNPNSVYLPNLSDPFDGEQSGLLYAQGLINADMSDVEVMHKVQDVALVSKKFITSRLDKVENQYLAPEEKIKLRLAEFGIPVQPVETKVGASVTQYCFKVSAGIPMSKILKHKSDIARAIEAKGNITILAPIPGTAYVGVEVPNETRTPVFLTKQHFTADSLMLPIGITVQGEFIKESLADMPHLLIAGATGSGKSILLHGIITALIKQNKPTALELILIDPKRVELTAFARARHLQGKKIIVEYEPAVRRLMELTDLMEARYKELEHYKKRDIVEYNATKEVPSPMPYIVTVIDEFADLMLRSKMEEKKKSISYSSKSKGWLHRELRKRGDKGGLITIKEKDTEERILHIHPIRNYDKDSLVDILETLDSMDDINRGDANIEFLVVRLAQMGRAVGIHLIIATQSPRVEVITGLIKANFPTRIALTTASHIDSEVIIGKAGAEKLTGKGDMIFQHPARQGEVRLQGFLIEK